MALNSIRRMRFVYKGFTLVELLVVIAIIGVLVALLLPAIQAAREAARKTQCSNQMRQMAVALQNHESTLKIFPTGGIDPWPLIEDYASGNKPYAAPKQGLSWAFQLLPYLEQNAAHSLVSSEQLPRTPVNLYVCPSRRGPTQNLDPNSQQNGRWLMDYAALVGSSTRNSVGDSNGSLYFARVRDMARYDSALTDGSLCSVAANALFWGGESPGAVHLSVGTAPTFTGIPTKSIFPTEGVIVRSSYFVEDNSGAAGNPKIHNLGLPSPTSFKQITDGASNTAVLCEKRIAVDYYEGGRLDDDAGWSDGWDYDTMRLAYCQPASDSTAPVGDFQMTSGSAHSSVFFCAFADAAVHAMSYDVDPETFNQIANKADGEITDRDF